MNAPIRGCRIDRRELGLGHHLLGQVRGGAIDATDNRPRVVFVDHVCKLRHSAGPRIAVPRVHPGTALPWFGPGPSQSA